ncbi:MAG: insulinase family protein [Planctomycetes bacterium]|nr:insulinase family protein [Planctomycetota bacterium]
MDLSTLDNAIGERILEGVLPHGLKLVMNPRAGFSRSFGMLATHYGSLDSRVPDGQGGGLAAVPDGIAHFLEHKLFEDRDGDVSLRFSSRGASCNAGTEFGKTAYHFSCADRLEENLETLIRFVYDPWFTPESVAKEQGIIAQEIRMYDDDPDWVVFFNLLELLYHSHPVRINIAGTVESIRRITPELLFRCHRAFYHPRNMVLAVAGGFDETRAAAVAERVMGELAFAPGTPWRRPRADEPAAIARKRHVQPFSVARPQLALGFKDGDLPTTPDDWLVRDLTTKLLLDVLFSASSRHHEKLYAADLIDDTFDAAYSGEHDFGFTILGGETDDPDRLAAALHETLATARREGIDAADFELARNRFLGRWVRAFNSAESLAGALVSGHFRGVRIDALPQVAMRLTPGDLARRLESHLREECSALSILTPDGARAVDAADGDDDDAG